MTTVIDSITKMHAALDAERQAGRSVALVPTMGALHDGHLALAARARERADVVVVSIFVNPLQFGPGEDLEKYPRTLEADVQKLNTVAYVFAPSVNEMYPDGPTDTRVTAGPVGSQFEGESRPGHFDGMLTVVAKLLSIVQPTVVVFGQKDAQQVFLVSRMVADLNLRTEVDVVEIVRDADGLALSSRNRYLSAGEKQSALVLSRALGTAAASARLGVEAAISAAHEVLAGEPLVELDYFAVVDPRTFRPVADDADAAIALIAARVGQTRLIDNRRIALR